MDECTGVESQFKDEKTGEAKRQDVCRVRFEGKPEALNVLNRATIRGLVEAFGSDSKEWIGKVLTVHTEKTTVAGRRVTALYLVPEGFEVGEGGEGYVQITRKGEAATAPATPNDDSDINPEDIPF